MVSNDWIDHDGQGAPDLPPGTRVQVRFRDEQTGSHEVDPWEYWAADRKDHRDHWVNAGDLNPWYSKDDDIIAYRVVQDEQ